MFNSNNTLASVTLGRVYNGGEFVNQEFNELAEKFNISVLTTAADMTYKHLISNMLCHAENNEVLLYNNILVYIKIYTIYRYFSHIN